MSLTEDEVTICNQALDKLGATTFTYAVQTSVQAVKCNLHYNQTRDALLRLYDWPFARWRAALVPDTQTPDFEWDYQYALPEDYMRLRPLYRDNDDFESEQAHQRYEIEGKKLLTDDSEIYIRYIRKITDPNDFDVLFTEVLILQLALKLPLAGAGSGAIRLKEDIKKELAGLMPAVRALNRQEANVTGRSSWNLSRLGST